MRFVQQHENGDLIWVAGYFAEAIANGDWDAAIYFANLAEDVTQGGFLIVNDVPPGRCRAVTRDARNCPSAAKWGEPYCGQHARLIRDHQERRELSSG